MKLRNVWRNFAERFKLPVKSSHVEELPDPPRTRILYLIGDEGEEAWQASMRCPCGCGSIIRLSLIPEDRPRWEARTDDHGHATLWPSVARHRGCDAHFVLRSGRIFWV